MTSNEDFWTSRKDLTLRQCLARGISHYFADNPFWTNNIRRRESCLAFLMGVQSRAGAPSCLHVLTDALLRVIFEFLLSREDWEKHMFTLTSPTDGSLTLEIHDFFGISLPRSVNVPFRQALCMIPSNDSLYFVAADPNACMSWIVRKFCPASVSWGYITRLPTARPYPNVVHCNGFLYILGCDRQSHVDTVVEKVDLATGSCTLVPPMPTSRYDFSALAIRRKIYVIGGKIYENVRTNVVEEFDTQLMDWISLKEMPSARTRYTLQAVRHSIYIAGGYGEQMKRTKAFHKYDIRYDVWVSLASLPMTFMRPYIIHSAGELFLFGGERAQAIHKYIVADNCWIRVDLPNSIEKPIADCVASGRIYVFGGQSGEVYVQESGITTWSHHGFSFGVQAACAF